MSCIPINDFSLITLCDATKAGKLYSIVPDSGAGDFDVVRASTATYLGADGLIKTAANNEPRIEFNPDGSYKGLLVEPAATNLVLRSEEFDDAYWIKQNATITADDTTAPDGTTTADKLVEDSSSNKHFFRAPTDHRGSFGEVLSNSFYAKEGEIRYLTFRGGHSESDFYSVLFDLQEGVVVDTYTGSSGVLHNFSIQKLPNGWCRCNVSGSVDIAITHRIFFINLIKNPNNVDNRGEESYLGNGTDGLFLWGAQIEEGTVATSYIQTVASTVTRAADSISKTGASALIGQDVFSALIEFDYDRSVQSPNGRLFNLFDNPNENENTVLLLINKSQQLQLTTRINRSASVLIFASPSTFIPFGRQKLALFYDGVRFIVYKNGEFFAQSNPAPYPSGLTSISFGDSTSSARSLNNHIKLLALLKEALTEQQAIQLTS